MHVVRTNEEGRRQEGGEETNLWRKRHEMSG